MNWIFIPIITNNNNSIICYNTFYKGSNEPMPLTSNNEPACELPFLPKVQQISRVTAQQCYLLYLSGLIPSGEVIISNCTNTALILQRPPSRRLISLVIYFHCLLLVLSLPYGEQEIHHSNFFLIRFASQRLNSCLSFEKQGVYPIGYNCIFVIRSIYLLMIYLYWFVAKYRYP